jgi:hypothetical protein
MPINGARYSGSVRTKLSTLVARNSFKQVDIKANPGNSANVCIGGEIVAADGTDAYIVLDASEFWGTKSTDAEDIVANWDKLYIIASGTDQAHIVVVS